MLFRAQNLKPACNTFNIVVRLFKLRHAGLQTRLKSEPMCSYTFKDQVKYGKNVCHVFFKWRHQDLNAGQVDKILT
jgi:hypothetical protein